MKMYKELMETLLVHFNFSLPTTGRLGVRYCCAKDVRPSGRCRRWATTPAKRSKSCVSARLQPYLLASHRPFLSIHRTTAAFAAPHARSNATTLPQHSASCVLHTTTPLCHCAQSATVLSLSHHAPTPSHAILPLHRAICLSWHTPSCRPPFPSE
jgi:hypothetical protein